MNLSHIFYPNTDFIDYTHETVPLLLAMIS